MWFFYFVLYMLIGSAVGAVNLGLLQSRRRRDALQKDVPLVAGSVIVALLWPIWVFLAVGVRLMVPFLKLGRRLDESVAAKERAA